MTYHRVSDGLLSLWVTMWIERLIISVIYRQEKLATQLCVFLKSTKTFVCLLISKFCTVKTTHVILLCTQISYFMTSFPTRTIYFWPLKCKVHVFEVPPKVSWKYGLFATFFEIVDSCGERCHKVANLCA